MERQSARLIVNTAGGTAGKDAKTYKAALPSSWIHALGLSDENRDMELSFDGESITISVPETYDAFSSRRAGKNTACLNCGFMTARSSAIASVQITRATTYIPSDIRTTW